MIVVVGNSPTPIRDFSKEVAEARLVVRVNKMDNYPTGLTGTRCDWWAMVPSMDCWWGLKRKGIIHLAQNASQVWIRAKTHTWADDLEQVISTLHNVQVVPKSSYDRIPLYFSDNRIANLCMELFPDEQVHLLGVDSGRQLRINRHEPVPQPDIEWRRRNRAEGRLLIN